MKPSAALLAAIFLTVFAIGGVGGIIKLTQTPQTPEDTVSQAEFQNLQQTYQEREAAYNQMIQQANQEIQALSDQLNQTQQAPEPTASPAQTSQAAITPENAASIAIQATGNGAAYTRLPELVDYQGAVVYEVSFPEGNVYVDANTGSVILNTIPQRITEQEAAQIAGKYWGRDPRYAQVKLVTDNGVELYRVNFGSKYVIFVDTTGQVVKTQVFEVASTGGGGSNSRSSGGGDDGEHEEQEDDD